MRQGNPVAKSSQGNPGRLESQQPKNQRQQRWLLSSSSASSSSSSSSSSPYSSRVSDHHHHHRTGAKSRGSQNATGQPCRKVFPGQPWETREPAAKEPAATVMNECCLLLTPSKHIHNACKQTLQAGTSVPAKNHACYHLCLKTAMSTCAN